MDELARLAALADPAAPPPPAYLAAVRARRNARRLTIAASSLTAAALGFALIVIFAPRPGTAPIHSPSLPQRAQSDPIPAITQVATSASAPPTLGSLMRLVRDLPPDQEIEIPTPNSGRAIPATMITPWRDPELLRDLTGL